MMKVLAVLVVSIFYLISVASPNIKLSRASSFSLNLEGSGPINISATNAQIDEHKIYLSGNVRLTSSDYVMDTDELSIVYNNGNVERIEAEGHLKIYILKEKLEISGEKLVYKQVDKQIFVIGNIVMDQEKFKITGDELVFNLENMKIAIKKNVHMKIKTVEQSMK